MKNLWKVMLFVIALLSMILVLVGCKEDEPEDTPNGGTHTCIGVTWVTEREADCRTEGSKKLLCSCGKTVKTEKIPKSGHTKVTVPGQAATCKENGLTDGKECSACGEMLVAQVEIPLASHTEVAVPGKAATCEKIGLTEGKECSVCGETLVAQVEIPLASHTEVAVPGKAATCEKIGLTEGKECSVCGETLVAQVEIPLASHTEVTVSGKAATCEETGLTEGKKCSVCGETLVAQTTLPLASHTYDDIYDEICNVCGFVRDAACRHSSQITIPGKSATCTETGLTDGKKCASCSETLVAQVKIPLANHTEETVPGYDASCTATGLTDGKKCSVCGIPLEAQTEIPLEDHNMVEGVCTECFYPYIVVLTVEDLKNVAFNLSANYILLHDLDLGGIEWTPVGTSSSNPFSGTFDGNGHVITNFKITGDRQFAALFGYSKGTIQNLGLENFMVDVSYSGDGSVYAGGLVGYNGGGTITNCYVTGDVSSTHAITSGYSSTCVGGLVGYGDIITNCYAMGDVSASSTGNYTYVGGLVGKGGIITNCYATGDASASSTGSYTYAGGLVGYNTRTITNCYATGNVSGTTTQSSSYSAAYAGGLVGYNIAESNVASVTGIITNCYATGDVSVSHGRSATYAGGLVGQNVNGTITNCYRYSGQSFTVTRAGTAKYFATNTVGMTTSIENLQSQAWIEEKLWKAEIEIWRFGTGYPTLDYEAVEAVKQSIVEITTKEYLLNLQAGGLLGNYKLMADIDLGGIEWQPIAVFFGTFDGNGHVISNFEIAGEMQRAGLFGYSHGTIQNLGLESFTVNVWRSGYVYAGGLVGYNVGAIKNCYATGDISTRATGSVNLSNAYAGGLVGYNVGGPITNCYALGDVSASSINSASSGGSTSYAGGLVGYNVRGTIINCYALGDVSASSAGGRDEAYAGGLVGYNVGGPITNCYATEDVSATGYDGATAGGLVGCDNEGTITNCYATGGVSAIGYYTYAGGLVGEGGIITNCYATGDVSASSSDFFAYVGGLVGYGGIITNCYATGDVSVSSIHYKTYAGGLVGAGNITNCYRYSGQRFTVTVDDTTIYEATNTGGTATDMATLQSVNFQQNTLLWSADDWSFVEGAHPTLKNAELAN